MASKAFAGFSTLWPLCMGYGSGLSCGGAVGVKGVSGLFGGSFGCVEGEVKLA